MREPSEKETISTEKAIRNMTMVSVIGNAALAAFKLLAGLIGQSAAMVSDAVHSLSDVLSTFIALIGVRVSQKEADGKHPYGHERLECVVALILANLLLLIGAGIGYNGIRDLMDPTAQAVPGMLALSAAVISLAVKEALFWYTRAAAKKINSVSLMAEAWHHRSDALSSIGSFVGILGAILGYPVLQPLACLLIALMILKVAVDIYRDTLSRLIDHSCSAEAAGELRSVVLGVDGVLGIDDMKTRLFGSRIYVDVEICCSGELKLREAHQIAEAVHHAVENSRSDIKHCMVHVNPLQEEAPQDRALQEDHGGADAAPDRPVPEGGDPEDSE